MHSCCSCGDDGKPKQLPWEDWRPGEDQHTSAWMRATSPSGSAEYQGRVAWSGELGYGIRPPERGQAADDAEPQQTASEQSGPDHDDHGGHH